MRSWCVAAPTFSATVRPRPKHKPGKQCYPAHENSSRRCHMSICGTFAGLLLLAGSIVMANAEECIVTLPGVAATANTPWRPTLAVREQTIGHADRRHPV